MSRPDESRRGTVRGFINYLKKYEERKATNREPESLQIKIIYFKS